MISLYLYNTTPLDSCICNQMRKLGKVYNYIPAIDRLTASIKNRNYFFKKNIKGIRWDLYARYRFEKTEKSINWKLSTQKRDMRASTDFQIICTSEAVRSLKKTLGTRYRTCNTNPWPSKQNQNYLRLQLISDNRERKRSNLFGHIFFQDISKLTHRSAEKCLHCSNCCYLIVSQATNNVF